MFWPIIRKSPEEVFERKLEKAQAKREELDCKNKLSVASGAGKLAVLYSPAAHTVGYFTNEHGSITRDFAVRLAKAQKPKHAGGAVADVIDPINMACVMRDPEYTDITFVGSIGNIGLSETDDDTITWFDLVRRADHLKRGKIEIRHPAIFPPGELVAPLGSFVTRNPDQILAIPNTVLPIDNNPASPIKLDPVFSNSEMFASQIHSLNIAYRDWPVFFVHE